MAVSAVGPVMAGGFEQFLLNDESGEQYTISFLPDRNNEELQRSGQQPVFYYIPEQVRIARKGDVGDFKFRQVHFVGVFDENSVGVEKGETQGGVVAFTTTSRYPTSVLKMAEKQILDKFSGRDDKYWGIRMNVAPAIRVALINSNTTAVSNMTPGADGLIPGEPAAGGGNPAVSGGGELPAAGTAGGTPGEAGAGAAGGQGDGPKSRSVKMWDGNPWESVPHGRDFRASGLALKPWAWRLDGQGQGSITGGENAYAGILGPLPSEILWAGFHGAYSTVAVVQNLIMPMWSQLMRLKITGSWSRIFDHFSGAANARYLWFSADIKAEFNSLRINGDIKVELDIDGTVPGGQDLEKAINQRIDMIVAQFTEQAKKVIFDPPMPQVEPAQAPSGGFFSSLFGGGGGLALKARHDSTSVNLSYEETRYFRYNLPHTISSTLEGFYNEIKKDPKAEQKYFTRLVLGGLGRKVMRFVKPVVNWPDKATGWAGQPVSFLSAQVGYPGEQGQIQWSAQTFQKSDSADTTFKPAFVERKMEEVQNPPAGWEPDKTFVKRKVHMQEPPSENEFPFTRIRVERNVVELDDPANGSLTNDNILEVRADEIGTLSVGPLALGVVLQSNSEVVEVEIRAKGKRADGVDRMNESIRFRWTATDQDQPRFLYIYTGQLDFVPAYQYRIHVTVKGTLTSQGQAWSGPWVEGAGNGALMVDVPTSDAVGVVKRSLTSREMFSSALVRAADIPSGVIEPSVGVPEPSIPSVPAASGPASGSESPMPEPGSPGLTVVPGIAAGIATGPGMETGPESGLASANEMEIPVATVTSSENPGPRGILPPPPPPPSIPARRTNLKMVSPEPASRSYKAETSKKKGIKKSRSSSSASEDVGAWIEAPATLRSASKKR